MINPEQNIGISHHHDSDPFPPSLVNDALDTVLKEINGDMKRFGLVSTRIAKSLVNEAEVDDMVHAISRVAQHRKKMKEESKRISKSADAMKVVSKRGDPNFDDEIDTDLVMRARNGDVDDESLPSVANVSD